MKTTKHSVIFLAVIGFIFIACSKDKQQEISDLKFIEDKVVNIPLDNETSLGESDIQFYENQDKKLLYLLNRKKRSILIYDWNTQKNINTIKLQSEGPEGVGNPMDLYVKSEDSVYILSRYTYLLSLVNRAGKVIDKYRLLPPNLPFDTKNMAPPQNKLGYSALPAAGFRTNGDIIDDGKRIFVVCDPNLNHNDHKKFYDLGKVNLIYDRNGKDVTYSVDFPEKYREKLFFPTQYNWRNRAYNSRKKKAIYSFPVDEYIYECDADGKNMVPHKLSSKYFDHVIPMSTPSISPEIKFKHAINNYSYGKVFFDKYRNTYYRWVTHPMNFEGDIQSATKLSAFHTSVIVADERFKVIGEALLPKKYFSGIAFINSEGIYLNNPTDDENFASFRLVKFKL